MSNGTTKQKGDRQGEFTEIGVFCGTFNPIHLGHLLIAECARDQFGLEKVFFVTSPRPPHRSTDLLDGEARHLMVSAAVADNPHFEASRLELERSGPSYTSETIRSLLRIYTDKETNANHVVVCKREEFGRL